LEQGHLAAYFTGVAAKFLSAVEIRTDRSHQHEFNGSSELVRLFGGAGNDKRRFTAKFVYLNDEDDARLVDSSDVTWYDARAKSAARTSRSEHRLYFRSNDVTRRAQRGDLLLLALTKERSLLAVIAPASSTIALQLHWLFRLPDLVEAGFRTRTEADFGPERLGLVASFILQQVGIDIDLSDSSLLGALVQRFGDTFPSMREFSIYARESLIAIDPMANPDNALMAWMDREEVLFRTLEKHLIKERLRLGFFQTEEPDVEGFLRYSLSVQNRRKARAGGALENHVEALLKAHALQFVRNATTERGNRPDFLFPGVEAYLDASFPATQLAMLATKTTAKDRWRQITKEADRIPLKHLLTLEPAISHNQTEQMQQSGIQLVIPSSLHADYTPQQRATVLDVRGFIEGRHHTSR
jgi:hypothetical protein